MSCNDIISRNLLDNFSYLPNDVLDIILSLVPLRDAVRTSILSRNWRFHWTRTQSLILDWLFFYHILDLQPTNDNFVADAYVRIVENILLSHGGSVRKFFLNVPEFEPYPDLDTINNWIHIISRCGVQDLSLEYDDEDSFPSSLFECVELRHLRLQSVQLEHPPSNFRKFSSLLSLSLFCASESGEMLTNIILNCPLLEKFSLDYMEIKVEDGPLILSAPKLKDLYIGYHHSIYFLLINNPNICTLSIQQIGRPCEEYPTKGQDMSDFFGAVPKIENVNLHSDILVEWAKRDIPGRLPARLNYLTSLVVKDLDISSLGQLHSLFCLVKSSPKLQTLNISMCLLRVEPQDTKEYLQSQVKLVDNMWRFRTVTITHLMGDETEMIFIQVVLSRCPNLEMLYLKSNHNVSFEAEYKMTMSIKRFGRASTQAEVIYSKLEEPKYLY